MRPSRSLTTAPNGRLSTMARDRVCVSPADENRKIPAVSANRQNTPTTASRPTNTRITSGGMYSPSVEIATATTMNAAASATTRHRPEMLRVRESSGLG